MVALTPQEGVSRYAKEEPLKLIYYPWQWEQIGVRAPTMGVRILNKKKKTAVSPLGKMSDKALKIWTAPPEKQLSFVREKFHAFQNNQRQKPHSL